MGGSLELEVSKSYSRFENYNKPNPCDNIQLFPLSSGNCIDIGLLIPPPFTAYLVYREPGKQAQEILEKGVSPDLHAFSGLRHDGRFARKASCTID